MDALRLALVRAGSFAIGCAQAVVSAFGGGNGDPMQLQEPVAPRHPKSQKKTRRR